MQHGGPRGSFSWLGLTPFRDGLSVVTSVWRLSVIRSAPFRRFGAPNRVVMRRLISGPTLQPCKDEGYETLPYLLYYDGEWSKYKKRPRGQLKIAPQERCPVLASGAYTKATLASTLGCLDIAIAYDEFEDSCTTLKVEVFQLTAF